MTISRTSTILAAAKEQRAVDAAEDLDRVEAVAGRARDFDFEAVAAGAGSVTDRLDAVLEAVADALAGLDRLDDQCGLALGAKTDSCGSRTPGMRFSLSLLRVS